MAIIQEEIIVIKISKLVKEGASQSKLVSNDTIAALEQVTAELLDSGVIVEVEQA